MQATLHYIKRATLLLILLSMLGCGSYMNQPYKPERARLGPETPMRQVLKNLPAPKEKVVAAVYKFRDQTGQYKLLESGSSWSTVVTQGATSILIRALDESGWFLPIERENINNLLNERKIIRSSRAQYEGKESDLPPLLFAGVLLEGGIISYETNLLTGGLGVRYFGIGSSTQYRMDRITVYLRAVSSSTGAILKTVYTSKTVLSQEVKANVYRYVSLTKLLEGEVGFTFNEPSELCLTEAIEKAVQSLVIEGLKEKYWTLNNPQDTLSPVLTNYALEKNINDNIDVFGNDIATPQQVGGQLSVGASAGMIQYNGDLGYGSWRPYGAFHSDFTLSSFASVGQNMGFSSFFVSGGLYKSFMDASIDLKLKVYPYFKLTPVVTLKGGALFKLKETTGASGNNQISPYTGAELGVLYRANRRFSFMVNGFYSYFLNDNADNVKFGNQNDQFWGVRLGFYYHL